VEHLALQIAASTDRPGCVHGQTTRHSADVGRHGTAPPIVVNVQGGRSCRAAVIGTAGTRPRTKPPRHAEVKGNLVARYVFPGISGWGAFRQAFISSTRPKVAPLPERRNERRGGHRDESGPRYELTRTLREGATYRGMQLTGFFVTKRRRQKSVSPA